MAYTKESMDKFERISGEAIAKIRRMDPKDIAICISNGNRKIGRAMNVSTMPCHDCRNCKFCKGYCYDIKANLFHTNTVLPARARNSVLANDYREKYFGEIRNRCKRRRTNKYFRWHVAGDILDREYFAEMVAIAKEFPDFVFWTYTKMFGIVNAWIRENGNLPENLHVMFSLWDGMKTPNPYNLPTFACRLKDGNKDLPESYFESTYKCPGNCDICKAAGRGCVVGESAYANEH